MLRTPVVLSVAPRDGPRELKPLTESSDLLSVPLVLAEPTVMTDGSWPGEPMVP